jgi:branched-chain amino acid transport system permease protein
MTLKPALTIAGLACLAILLILLPSIATNYFLRLATIAFMYAALASSWNFIGGFTGYPSFATAAFFGIGAYASAILRTRVDVPLPVGWLCGGVCAAMFALVVGTAILRVRGHYFAVASLVLAAVLREVINSATSLTGGGMGLNLPASAGSDVTGQAQVYYAAMASAAAFTVALAALILRSRLGWAMRCIEQNEDAATVLGINTLAAKVAAFVASAATAGLVGAIYATWIGYIDPTDVFDDLLSVKPIVMAFIGGVGTVAGPVAGAIIFLVLEEFVWRNVLNFHAGILGILIVLLLIFVPGGLGSLGRAITMLRSYGRVSRLGKGESPLNSALS